MSDVATGRARGDDGVFRGRTVALMLAIGIAGFVGMLVLGAYAPDLATGRNGGGHALSDAATGYSGLVRLAAATGRHPTIVRSDHLFGSENLLVATPESGFTPLDPVTGARRGKPTLIVLPKWATAADPSHRGWVRYTGLKPRFDPEGVLAPDYPFTIARRRSGGRRLVAANDFPAGVAVAAPRPLQVITGLALAGPADRQAATRQRAALTPLLTDGRGGIVLARIGGGPLYVLADPDLLANQGLKDARAAAFALTMLDWLNSNGADGIGFDVTLNGLGHSPSPLKLAFEPPFVAMTIALAAAALLAGLHALGRFGPAARRVRAIVFGKTALVDNSAMLVRKAGREAQLGGRYAAAQRERAVATFGVPAAARGPAADAYLDALGGGARFTALVRDVEAADDPAALVAAARALHAWQRETVR